MIVTERGKSRHQLTTIRNTGNYFDDVGKREETEEDRMRVGEEQISL